MVAYCCDVTITRPARFGLAARLFRVDIGIASGLAPFIQFGAYEAAELIGRVAHGVGPVLPNCYFISISYNDVDDRGRRAFIGNVRHVEL